MKTEDLIVSLARSAGPAPQAVVARRIGPVVALGALMALGGALAIGNWVGQAVMLQPGWLFKAGYTVVLALLAGLCAAALARPAVPVGRRWAAVGALFLLVLGLGALEWWATPSEARMASWMGHSWLQCPYRVLALSLPTLVLALWALRGLAPTRPVWAGLAAGLMAGGVGASVYALTCTETALSFVATWYTLGVLASGALGALLGPRVLRW
jgi:hypothetical protein